MYGADMDSSVLVKQEDGYQVGFFWHCALAGCIMHLLQPLLC